MSFRPYLLVHTLILSAVLSACTKTAQTAPVVKIVAPLAGSTVEDQVTLELEVEGEVGQVAAWVREPGSNRPGQRVASATRASMPGRYTLSWDTRALPQGSTFELYARATGNGGLTGESAPLTLSVNHPDAPALTYFAGFSLPPALGTQGRSRPLNLVALGLNPELLVPHLVPASIIPESTPRAVLEPNRRYAVEWAWPRTTPSYGYGLDLSRGSGLGPYERLHSVREAPEQPLQRFSRRLEPNEGDERLYGALTLLSTDGSSSARSNAGEARFLSEQRLDAPQDGATVPGGRPNLLWSAHPDTAVSGYLYFMYRNNPLTASEAPLWSAGNTPLSARGVAYPRDRDPLPLGSYYWWVAGVSFNAQGKATGFSFSAPRRFEVR